MQQTQDENCCSEDLILEQKQRTVSSQLARCVWRRRNSRCACPPTCSSSLPAYGDWILGSAPTEDQYLDKFLVFSSGGVAPRTTRWWLAQGGMHFVYDPVPGVRASPSRKGCFARLTQQRGVCSGPWEHASKPLRLRPSRKPTWSQIRHLRERLGI